MQLRKGQFKFFIDVCTVGFVFYFLFMQVIVNFAGRVLTQPQQYPRFKRKQTRK